MGGGSNSSLNAKDGNGALVIFEDTIRDVRSENILSAGGLLNRQAGQSIEVESLDTQDFLASQVELLERLGVDEEHGQGGRERGRGTQSRSMGYRKDSDGRTRDSGVQIEEGGRVSEHIGPVQFNMGGIQVDADDMLKRLKVRYGAVTS
jgi:dynein light intermediate chain 1